jgi:hypothetical protein
MKGSYPRCRLKSRLKSSRVKNVGKGWPTKAKAVASWSKREYGLTAEMTLTGGGDAEGEPIGCAEHTDVHPAGKGVAPLPPQPGHQPTEITQGQRIIEPELLPQVQADLGRDIRIERQLLEGIAGRQGQDAEQHHADPQHSGDGDQEPSQ